MTRPSGIGILGIGTYLPPHVRTNDWWPAETVARWTAQQARQMEGLRRAPPQAHEGARRVVRAMLELGGDPFEGAVERRILADDMTATDMETAAAEAAIARAAVDRSEIDLLLTHPAVPDYLLSNTACALHQRLGLPATCFSLEAQASAFSFMAQLALALPMIESGRVRTALLVQSAVISRLIDPADPVSARVGDAATAVVVGKVGDGFGVAGSFHRTDGSFPRTLIASVPGGRWYDGRSIMHVADPDGARRVFLDSVDQSKEAIDGAVAAAGVAHDQIAFLAVHHATPWVRELVQEHVGLAHARSIDLFAKTAYVFSTSIPLVLAAADADGAIGDGDLVVLLGAGTGMMRGATVIRWGRAQP